MSDDRRKYDDELKDLIKEAKQEVLDEILPVKKEVTKIWVLLNGNGEEGLVAKISRHESWIASVQGYIRTAATGIILLTTTNSLFSF